MVKRSQRVVALFAAVIILFEVAAVPQKAKAVAVTASVVASVAAIMTACGVSYWAASQTEAVEYLGGKIDEYIASLDSVPESYEDWLGISGTSLLFEVVSGGVMRFGSGVANKVLDFVRWFSADEGIVSAGPVVSNASFLPYISGVKTAGNYAYALGSASATLIDSSHIRFDFDAFEKSDGRNSKAVAFAVVDECLFGKYTATITEVNWSYPSGAVSGTNVGWSAFETNEYSESAYKAYNSITSSFSFTLDETFPYLGFNFINRVQEGLSGYAIVEISSPLLGTPATASVTPSSSVVISEDIPEDDSFDVSPSVGLTQGMSVDNATDAIMGGVVSEDGLSSESSIYTPPIVDLNAIASRLDDIETALLALGNAVDSVDGDTSAIQSSIAMLLSRASSIQNSITALDNNLDNVDDNVNDVALAVSGISGQIDNLENDVTGLVGSLGSISQGNSEIQDSISGLSSAIAGLNDDMELVKDALAGLTANDSLVDDVGDIKTNTSGILGLLSTIAQTVLGLPQAIGQAAQDVISGIQSLPGMISDALTDLFVPDEAFVETYVDSLVGLFEGRVGILTYPFSLFVEFLHRFTRIGNGEHIFQWGAIREPFSGRQIIAAGSYDLDDAVALPPMSSVYSLYLIAVKAIVAFWFLHLCQKKYDQIINRH